MVLLGHFEWHTNRCPLGVALVMTAGIVQSLYHEARVFLLTVEAVIGPFMGLPSPLCATAGCEYSQPHLTELDQLSW